MLATCENSVGTVQLHAFYFSIYLSLSMGLYLQRVCRPTAFRLRYELCYPIHTKYTRVLNYTIQIGAPRNIAHTCQRGRVS